MDGKRFGVGIAAGLLVGLAVIAASGGLAAVSGSVLSPPGLFSSAGVATTTATSTATQSQTSAIARSTTTNSQPIYDMGGNTTNSLSSGSATETTTGGASLDTIKGLVSSVTSPSYSSHIASIAQQPPLSNAVIFVPVIVAFLLGAILYRTSSRSKEETSEA